MVVDNSGSMTEEILAIQNNINTNFAGIIEASGIDYRFIIIATHGDYAGPESICISGPLTEFEGTENSCDPIPAIPRLTDRFKHYSVEVSSNNSLDRIIEGYNEPDNLGLAPNGWSEWLREDSVKVFVEFTDDNQRNGHTADTFDTALLALSPLHFGTAEERNYTFHSVVGVTNKDDTNLALPHLPADPIEEGRCSTAVNNGRVYQDLSIKTDGLRFSVCNDENYDVIFNQVAIGVVESVGLPCTYALPPAPDGDELDPERVVVTYTPGGAATSTSLERVDAEASCTDDSWFYNEDGEIALCPTTCSLVEADETAAIRVLTGCAGRPID